MVIVLLIFVVFILIEVNGLKRLERAKRHLEYAYQAGIWKEEPILTARLIEEKEFRNALADGKIDQINQSNGWANIERRYVQRFGTPIQKP